METPDRKVTVGLVAGAIMTVLAWISNAFFGVLIPAEVALSGSTIILFILQYHVTNKVPGASASSSEAGFVKLSLLWILALIATLALMGCQHTREAYQETESPDEYAFVLTEHYSALLKEGADLAERPTTPRMAVEVMQQVEAKLTPTVMLLKELRDAYVAVRDAQTEADLQAQIDKAVLLIADMIRAIRSARAEPNAALDPLDRYILERAQVLRVLEAAA